MPHNLYLHSALVKSRNVDRKKNEAVRQANMYYFVEAAIALLVCYTLDYGGNYHHTLDAFTIPTKTELLQLNHTQFICLRI